MPLHGRRASPAPRDIRRHPQPLRRSRRPQPSRRSEPPQPSRRSPPRQQAARPTRPAPHRPVTRRQSRTLPRTSFCSSCGTSIISRSGRACGSGGQPHLARLVPGVRLSKGGGQPPPARSRSAPRARGCPRPGRIHRPPCASPSGPDETGEISWAETSGPRCLAIRSRSLTEGSAPVGSCSRCPRRYERHWLIRTEKPERV